MGILDWLRRKPGTDVASAQGSGPREADGAPPPPPANSRRGSRPHLLLLSKFMAANSPKTFDADYWSQALGELGATAIEAFRKDGLLVEASLQESLANGRQATELKALARAKGVKGSGTKVELAERLVAADPAGMRALCAESPLLVCSPEGSELGASFRRAEDAHRQTVEAEVLELIKLRRGRDAARVVSRFEASQIFSRGVGIDWSRGDDPGGSEPALNAIFGGVPKILSGASEADIEALRTAAAASLLWGDNRGGRWLPDGYTGQFRCDHDVAVRMFVFYGQHIRDLESYRGIVKQVEVMGTGDGCSECKKISGRKFAVAHAPELPHPRCTSEVGCRCCLMAVFD